MSAGTTFEHALADMRWAWDRRDWHRLRELEYGIDWNLRDHRADLMIGACAALWGARLRDDALEAGFWAEDAVRGHAIATIALFLHRVTRDAETP